VHFFPSFHSLASSLILVVSGAVMAAALFLIARWSWRWFVAIVVVILGVLLHLWLPRVAPPQDFLSPSLPALFSRFFWTWVFLFSLGVFLSLVALARVVRAARPVVPWATAPSAAAEPFPELDEAWREILFRLNQAQIDLGRQHVVLVLAPQDDWTAALVQAAGLQLFAQAPEGPAPIRAYATANGVLIGAAGASAFGTQDPATGGARLEDLARKLLAQRPDCPIVRGVVVVFPIAWAARADAVAWSAAVRDDLRALQRVLKIRCPVFAFFPQMETVPGFLEFLQRMARDFRDSRVGFAVPPSHEFSGDLVNRGLTWLSGWFHGWILNRMSDDPWNQEGNNELFTLGYETRRFRKRLRAILEAAFSTHREAEPHLVRGCYFLATGARPHEQAFAAGLLRGARARVFAEHRGTLWSRDAIADDRRYKRTAFGVGLAGALLTLSAWAYIVTLHPLWWIGLIAIVLGWIVAVTRISLL
jgi:type VI protein secretion system component VasK